MDDVTMFNTRYGFDLPEIVGARNGVFADNGIDLQLIERGGDWEEARNKVVMGHKESMLQDRELDCYGTCEWGSIKRATQDGVRVIGSRRFTDFGYDIFAAPDSGLSSPEDLAGVEIAVNSQTGSHYAALEQLPAFMDEDAVRATHFGKIADRFQALRAGEIEAAVLFEPYSSLAEFIGLDRVHTMEARNAIMGHASMSQDAIDRVLAALTASAELINQGPQQYRDDYIEMLRLEEESNPQLFDGVDVEAFREHLTVPEYPGVTPVPDDRLQQTLDWMYDNDLIGTRSMDGLTP